MSEDLKRLFATHGVNVRVTERMSPAELEAFQALIGQPYTETRHIFATVYGEYLESRKAASDDCEDTSG